jgi:hypothetical protein
MSLTQQISITSSHSLRSLKYHTPSSKQNLKEWNEVWLHFQLCLDEYNIVFRIGLMCHVHAFILNSSACRGELRYTIKEFKSTKKCGMENMKSALTQLVLKIHILELYARTMYIGIYAVHCKIAAHIAHSPARHKILYHNLNNKPSRSHSAVRCFCMCKIIKHCELSAIGERERECSLCFFNEKRNINTHIMVVPL